MKPWRWLLCGAPLVAVACGAAPTNTGENYGNLLTTAAGLVLTQDEHIGGWQRTDCTTCHNLDNIHLINRSGVAVDVAAIHDQTLQDGNAGCPVCHGTNGVP